MSKLNSFTGYVPICDPEETGLIQAQKRILKEKKQALLTRDWRIVNSCNEELRIINKKLMGV